MASFNHGDVVEHSPAPYSDRFARFARVLGEGAVKRVYEAVDKDHGKLVAWNEVDIRHLPIEQRALLEAEVELLRAVRHVNIIDFYGSWATENAVVFITEIVESGDLRRFYSTHRVKLKVIKKWCRQILSALAYLHEHSPPVVHRDIKCENMLYNATEGTVKVGDLGLSCSADVAGVDCADSRVGDGVCGTPAYMAPEVYEGVVNEGIDIYAFGMAVLEMISHAPPYSECTNSAQIFKRVIEGVKPAALNRLRFSAIADFINFCITLQNGVRPSAQQVLAHPFLDDNSFMPEDEEYDLIMPDEGGPGDGISPLLPSELSGMSPKLEGVVSSGSLSDFVAGVGSGSSGGGSVSVSGLPLATAIGGPLESGHARFDEVADVDEVGDGWEAPPTEQPQPFHSLRGHFVGVNESSSSSLPEEALLQPSSGGPFFSQPRRTSSDTESPVYRMSGEITPIGGGDAHTALDNLTETPFTTGRSFPNDILLSERNESFPEDHFLPPAFAGGSFSETSDGGRLTMAMGASFGDNILSPDELATETMLSPTGTSLDEGYHGANSGVKRLVLSGASNYDSAIDRVGVDGDGKSGISSSGGGGDVGHHHHSDGGSLDSVDLLIAGTRRESSNMTGRVAFSMDETNDIAIARRDSSSMTGRVAFSMDEGGGDWAAGSHTSGDEHLMHHSESMGDLEHLGSFLPHADVDADLITSSHLWVDSNAAGTTEGALLGAVPSEVALDFVGVVDDLPSVKSENHDLSPAFTGSEMSGSMTGDINLLALRLDGSNSSDDGRTLLNTATATSGVISAETLSPLTPAISTPENNSPRFNSLAKLNTPPVMPESRIMFAGRTPMLNGRAVVLIDVDNGGDTNNLLSNRGYDDNVPRGDNISGGGPLSVFSDDLNSSAAALNLFSPPLTSSSDSYNGLAGLISPVNLVPFTPQQRQNLSLLTEASPANAIGQMVSPESVIMQPAEAFDIDSTDGPLIPMTFPLELVVTHGIGSAAPASATIRFNFDSSARADADQVPQEITHSLSKVFSGSSSEDIDWVAFRPFLASLLETQRHGFAVSIRAESASLHVALGPVGVTPK